MKEISEITARVLEQLPEPSSDKRDNTPQNTIPANCPACSPNARPLRTPWQQRRINLDSRPPKIQEMADCVESWCRNFARRGGDRVIVLVGPFGCGKTHCLRAARRYVRDVRMEIWPEPKPWNYPPTVYSCNWAEFVREATENDNAEIREDLLSGDVVFVDDIGAEEDRFRSGAPTRLLADILERIHEKRKFAFITSNVSACGWRERWDGRVEDRLLRMDAQIVDLNGCESYSTWKLKNP